MKQIIIKFGEEFRPVFTDVITSSNDIFEEQYKQADTCFDSIIATNITNNINDTNKINNCDNNIIAFTGERGQGKTSAMYTFIEGKIKINSKHLILDHIDPSIFENMHNIVEVVVTMMYNMFDVQREKDGKKDYSELIGLFQTVYESLALVRNPNKFDDLEYDYEGTIQKISRAGDSTKLKHHMWNLVTNFLKFANREDGFLIIPVDDLDLNISLAYKMVEQIRKYLIIPNVVIIMALKIEQLKFCVELQYKKEMKELLDDAMRLNKQEPIDMAERYIEKLIPDVRRIVLPSLRLFATNSEIAIQYMKDGKNLLTDYEELGIEKTIIAYIYKKTGLRFVASEHRIHPIIPNTLRELVNIMSVLVRLREDNLQNIIEFENYMLNSWIPNNLDDGNAVIINKLRSTNPLAMNETICPILLDKLDTLKIFTLYDNPSTKKVTEGLKRHFIKTRDKRISLGDTIALINFFESYYTDSQPKLFAFALKTLYSLTMLKMVRTTPKLLYDFVGGSIWGHEIVMHEDSFIYKETPRIESCISTSIGSKESRTYFKFNSSDFLSIKDKSPNISKEKLSTINNEDLNNMLFISDFKDGFIYGNGVYDKYPTFNFENIIVSAVYPDCIKEKIGDIEWGVTLSSKKIEDYFNNGVICEIVSNVEFSQYIFDYMSEAKRALRKAAKEMSDHIMNLIFNMNAAIGHVDLIEHIEPREIFVETKSAGKWFIDLWDRCQKPLADEEKVVKQKQDKYVDELVKRIKASKSSGFYAYKAFDENMSNIMEYFESVDSYRDIIFIDQIKPLIKRLNKWLIDNKKIEPQPKMPPEFRKEYFKIVDYILNQNPNPIKEEDLADE